MKTKTVFTILAMIGLMGQEASPAQQTDKNETATIEAKTEVRLASDIQWRKLNPARGDASPQAGTIWGDQTKEGESGFLVKFVDGFSSPPHIHNITYRGIVLSGLVHNDDPEAEPMWMSVGSWWTQPAGEIHVTSARGAAIGYVEIQSGPYLVKPGSEAFDSGERPVNMDASNIIWLDGTDTTWIDRGFKKDKSPKLTFMWGNPKRDHINGTMLKLPAGFSGVLETESSTFKVIVIKGQTQIHAGDEIKTLTVGGYIGSQGKVSHHLTCQDECVVYVRTKGKYRVVNK